MLQKVTKDWEWVRIKQENGNNMFYEPTLLDSDFMSKIK